MGAHSCLPLSRAARVSFLVLLLGACATANVAINRSFDFSRVKRVAIVGFSDYPRRPGSGEIVTGAFEQSLLAAGYDLLERAQVAKVLQEQKLSGRLDPKTAAAMGRLLGVDALILGRITDLAEPRDAVARVDVVGEHVEPRYRHRGVPGYAPVRVVRREQHPYTIDGRLGVSARMVYVGTGEVVWSGSDSTQASSFEECAQILSDAILKAVQTTWPSQKNPG